ncbi:hypothetical protein [Acinetobacter sp. YH12140]|uniref:hypothetical protein n=1 Tax=Acinetobacter sp. YH12140 TaxID=2601124 RepID=UPI0015D1D238|nr:hypothetical protein [Acinetobacter sp. YH12140]
MKKLLIFSAGVALGCFLKKPKVQSEPKFVLVDERESLSDYLFSPDGTKAFVKFFKKNRPDL